jgi:SAM-dependent MidA family methyltransferase
MPTTLSTSLPVPSVEAAQHSNQLIEMIRQEIFAQGGWVSFSRYMELALYAPGLGYYTAGAHKFGEAGDFITAPELSPLFGRTMARQVAEIMAGSSSCILELGAGSGKLAADILSELEKIGHLPDRYTILEVSADLRARQQLLLKQRLPQLFNRIHWLDTLPENFSGAIVANEVLDALPVHMVQWQDSTWHEMGVVQSDSGFAWQAREITDPELLQLAQQVQVSDNYVSEICLAARGLVNSLASRMTQGVMIFIDYGFGVREYYHPQRSSGTLMCHYRHRAHDNPFFLPGLQDITAHVNFTDIAEVGIEAGLELLGYTNQAFFLINCGITELLNETAPENLREYLPLSGQLQRLTSPAEMGELFKVIALGKNFVLSPSSDSAQAASTGILCGFSRGDLSRML